MVQTRDAASEQAPGDGEVPAALAPLPPRQVRLVFVAVMSAMVLAALDQTIVATALPTIVGELRGVEQLAWVITAYLLASTVATPIYGKLGDQFGRKRLLQIAVVLFLGGSALCGMAQSMVQLAGARAVQGLGAGGLMVLSMAVIAEVATVRQRSKYQGYFGAVFGVSTIAGPLLGGFITDTFSWRWIFYVNLPIGLVSFLIIGAVVPGAEAAAKARIDYLGAALFAPAVGAIVLATTWGGREHAWTSPTIVALAAGAVALLVAFLLQERRAPDPLLPLWLFREPTVRVTSAISFVQGLAMLGAMSFIPLFLQLVVGVSATSSGMNLAPMMGGMLLTSILSGQVISRTGHYRVFPILGTAIAVLAAVLLSTMGEDTTRWTVMGYMVLLGAGMGLVMQVTVLAAQNAVEPTALGVVTSTVTFFRSVGSSIGVAIFGAVFNARLASALAANGVPSRGAGAGVGSLSPDVLERLPEETRRPLVAAFASAIPDLFLVAAPVLVVAFVLALLLPNRPLRDDPLVEATAGAAEV